MSKQQTPALAHNFIEVKTTVTYKDEALESAIRIDSDEIAQRILKEGPEVTNKSIASALQALYNKTNDNFKSVVNK
jgi:predicted ABC-type ATPase